jgi:maleate cis-trans isomerase
MAPEGVTVHTARLWITEEATIDTLLKMEDSAEEVAESVATAEVSVIVYGCTSGSFIKDRNGIKRSSKSSSVKQRSW